MTIKCLLHYAPGEEDRCHFPAAEEKIDYLLSCVQRAGHEAQILSACRTEEGRSSRGGVKQLRPGITLELLPCSGGNKWETFLFYYRLTLRLLQFVSDGDTLWAYHALPLMVPLRIVRRLRRIRLILETEELYGDVLGKNWIRRRELAFFKTADGFLVPSRELDRLISAGDRPRVICHGAYVPAQAREKTQNGTVHVVYAGSADPGKGAFSAMEAAAFLPENFHVHILGTKTPEIRKVLNRVKPRCMLTHHGSLDHGACRAFLRSCHIGLCTQNPEAAFSESAFPSKILTYLSCGLEVVCTPIAAVRGSEVGGMLHYSESSDPEAVARAVLRAAEETGDRGSARLLQLDQSFLPLWKALLEMDGKTDG